MYGVELYASVRRAVVDDGLSHREASRRVGMDRRTVRESPGLCGASGLSAEGTGEVAEGGGLQQHYRRDFGGGPRRAAQARLVDVGHKPTRA